MIRSPFIAQSFVYGQSLESSLVAVVVPDSEFLMPWAEKNGIEGDFAALCQDPTVVEAVLKDVTRIGRESKLFGFEIAKVIKLTPEPFSAENNLLTPTFKLKRHQARQVYQADLDALYAKVHAAQ
jgi:long-chain acyl-CoA synthetase